MEQHAEGETTITLSLDRDLALALEEFRLLRSYDSLPAAALEALRDAMFGICRRPG
jgi:hypothetical protein